MMEAYLSTSPLPLAHQSSSLAWKASSTATLPMRQPVKSQSHKLPQHRHCLLLLLHQLHHLLLPCLFRHHLLLLRLPDHHQSLQQFHFHQRSLINTVRLPEST
jgi:hypothetical protein